LIRFQNQFLTLLFELRKFSKFEICQINGGVNIQGVIKAQSFLNLKGLGNLESPRFPQPVRFRKPKTGKVSALYTSGFSTEIIEVC